MHVTCENATKRYFAGACDNLQLWASSQKWKERQQSRDPRASSAPIPRPRAYTRPAELFPMPFIYVSWAVDCVLRDFLRGDRGRWKDGHQRVSTHASPPHPPSSPPPAVHRQPHPRVKQLKAPAHLLTGRNMQHLQGNRPRGPRVPRQTCHRKSRENGPTPPSCNRFLDLAIPGPGWKGCVLHAPEYCPKPRLT